MTDDADNDTKTSKETAAVVNVSIPPSPHPTPTPPPAIPCPPLQCQVLLVIPDEGDASPKMTEKYVNVYSFLSCVASFYPEFLPLFV